VKRIFVALALILGLAGCSSINTQADEAGLHYSGGSLSSATFENCVGSSTRNYDGPSDSHYKYPAGQRTFSFTGRVGSEAPPITVTTNDGQELSVPGFVTFTLNTSCQALRDFHEKVGIKYQAYTDAGWAEFLNDYLYVPLAASMNEASLQGNWQDLYSKAEVQTAFEQQVKADLPSEVKDALGEDFITINSVSIEKPRPGQGLIDGLAAKEEARLQNEAQEQRNAVNRTKYDSFKDCRQAGISEDTCLVLKLAEDGDIDFLPVPSGTGVNLNAR